MITKEQAQTAQEFHYIDDTKHKRTGLPMGCYRLVGPKGGVKSRPVVYRRNGSTQTWKTRPDHFRIPVKFGMYEYGNITQDNAQYFYVASECPVCSVKE